MELDGLRRAFGCLLIGESKRMRALREQLAVQGVDVVTAPCGKNFFAAAQEGLCAARRPGGVGIAVEGELWAVALSLAAQLSVDRIVLIAPTDAVKNKRDQWERQIERLKGYARRNLSFCVSEILILEEMGEERAAKCVDALCRGLCNSRVWRLSMADQRWTNCEQSSIEAAARFLLRGDFGFSLAKNL